MDNLQQTVSGYDFLLVNTPVVTEYMTDQKYRQLSELRTKFLSALQVDKDQVMHVYKSTLEDIITCSDFEDTSEGWYDAESTAIEEAIYKAGKLEEKESCWKGCNLEFIR